MRQNEKARSGVNSGRAGWGLFGALAVLVTFLMVASALSGFAFAPAHQSPSASGSSFSPLIVVNNGGSVQTTCSAVTTCTTASIAVAAYSVLLIGITSYGTVAPTGVTVSVGGSTTDLANTATGTAPVSFIYSVLYTAGASPTATVTFAASTYYLIDLQDFANTVATAVYSDGSATSSGSSTTATCLPSTAYTGDMIYALVGVETTAETTITPGTGMVQLEKTATATNVVTQESQNGLDSATGEYTVSATLASTAVWRTDCVALLAAAVPSAPTSLASGSITATTIPLTWTNYLSQAPGWISSAEVYWASYSGSCGPYSSSASASTPFNSYTITGLTAGGLYCIEVTDSNSTGASIPSTALTAVQTSAPPNAPTLLVANPQPGSTTQVNLAWTAPAGGGQTSYTLDQYAGLICGGGASATTGIDPLATTYLVSSLSANTAYSYILLAVNANGNSASSCAGVTTFSVPAAPTILATTGATAYQVSLAWVNPTGVNLYNDTILVGTTCGTWTFAKVSVGVASAGTVTGLAPNTKYCFMIWAWSGGAHSLSWAELNVTTLAGVPGTPTAFAQSGATATTESFTWVNPSPVTGSLTNATAYWGTSCGVATTGPNGAWGTWTKANVVSLDAEPTSHTFTGLAAATSYCFSITMWTQGGQGTQATALTETTPAAISAAPTSLTYASAASTSVTMTWTQATGGIILSNTLYWTSTAGCGSGNTAVPSGGPTTSQTVSGLTSATTYYWSVTATDSGGESAHSSCVTGATFGATPPAPYNLESVTVGVTFVSLTWVNPSGYSLIDNIVHVYASDCSTPVQTDDQITVDAYYQVTGLVASTTYCITVTAIDASSPPSAPLVVTTATFNLGGGGIPGGIGLVEIGGLLLAGAVGLGLLVVYARRNRHY